MSGFRKILEQGVSKVYFEILGNACETFPVFFCVCSSSNACVSMRVTWHTFKACDLTYLYEQVVWKCKRKEKLKTDCESYKLYHTNGLM